MSYASYQTTVDTQGINDASLIEDVKQAVDVYSFVHANGVYKGQRYIRVREVSLYLQALKHPSVSLVLPICTKRYEANNIRKQMNNLIKKSETLSAQYHAGGSVGELMIALLMCGQYPTFSNVGLSKAKEVYLPLEIRRPVRSKHSRRLVTYKGKPVMCVQAMDASAKSTNAVRAVASACFPDVKRNEWGVEYIKDKYEYS